VKCPACGEICQGGSVSIEEVGFIVCGACGALLTEPSPGGVLREVTEAELEELPPGLLQLIRTIVALSKRIEAADEQRRRGRKP
jgi:hypothetical protein